MQAILATADPLTRVDRPRPTPKPGEVLIRIHATALNRADLLQRTGRYDPPPGVTDILGLECAGVIEATGAGVEQWRPGDRAMALLPGGGYAEYVAVPAGHVMPVPDRLPLEDAAALPEVFLTAFQALFWLGHLTKGETLLQHAGASGVGTAAIQLARAAGATVYVTASAGKHAACLALGADAAFDYHDGDWPQRVLSETKNGGAQLIVDMIGAPYFDGNVQALATDGRLILLALMGGTRLKDTSLVPFFRKRATLQASTLRNRTDAYKGRLVAAFTQRYLPLVANGALRPVIDQRFDWADAETAHARMAANANVGKIILRVHA